MTEGFILIKFVSLIVLKVSPLEYSGSIPIHTIPIDEKVESQSNYVYKMPIPSGCFVEDMLDFIH